MNKFILSITLIGFSGLLNAQVTKPTTKPTTKPATPAATVLKTQLDSLSYIMGEIAALTMAQQGLQDVKVNSTVFLKGFNDLMAKKKPVIEDVVAFTFLNNYITKMNEVKVQPTIAEGASFLAENKKKPNVKTTASGLQYEVLREGTGPKPAANDIFVANYSGKLLNGFEFDNSYNRGQPLEMPCNKVIAGWTEGLQLMPVGSKYKFWIPYNIGYGTNGNPPNIPGGATLVFEVELLDVKKQ